MFRRIYFDNAATTPLEPRVLEAMLPYLSEKFGNASSFHFFGQEARAAVDKARHQVAAAINARPNEIVFTSGGTEADNLAIRGLCEANERHGRHVITSAIEHPAVNNVCAMLEEHGFEVTTLPVNQDGIVSVDAVRAAIRPDTLLITVMTGNNEIGTVQPVAEIGGVIREEREKGNKLWFHTDAVQAIGRMEVDVEDFGCDLLSISAHKIYAPKGVGGLYVRRGVRIQPQQLGGHQERERRGGTENVANIVAFGAAAEFSQENLDQQIERLFKLREIFEHGVCRAISGVVINGNAGSRLPHISNLSFSDIEGEGLLINLDMQGIAVSTGSACSSGSLDPSPVILALGQEEKLARGAVRFSFGQENTEKDIEHVLKVLPKAVESLRRLSPYYQALVSQT